MHSMLKAGTVHYITYYFAKLLQIEILIVCFYEIFYTSPCGIFACLPLEEEYVFFKMNVLHYCPVEILRSLV